MEAVPDILNHNLETIERLYRIARPGGRYPRALELLRRAKAMRPDGLTKSGLICGLGEEWDELLVAMRDLREQDVDILTVGQYLRPSAGHLPIARWYTPDEFAELKRLGLRHGIPSRGIRPAGALELSRLGTGNGRHGSRRFELMTTATVAPETHQADAALHRRMLREMLLIRRFEEKAARGLRARQDRRLLPPLHRAGGGRGRRARPR